MLIALLLTSVTAATTSGEIYAPKYPVDKKLWTSSLTKVQLDGENIVAKHANNFTGDRIIYR